MNQTFFHLIFVITFVIFWGIRFYFQAKAHRGGGDYEFVEEDRSLTLRKLLGLPFLLLFLAFFIRPSILAFAEIHLPLWAQWLGVALAILAIPLIVWVQWALDVNFNSSLHIREEHTMISHGPYRWVRHPMYTVLLIHELAILLLTRNLIIGGLLLGMQLLVVALRLRHEEALMVETFGDEYRQYMQRTGRFLPRLFA
ncbi:MAG: isoprenylcysteine carboxylmethyltransferase family protein [Chloroflexi bacterium]|nr:isoprenylcysteine carboxylmethyltransferase family protein [Chloroflexota bacterium]